MSDKLFMTIPCRAKVQDNETNKVKSYRRTTKVILEVFALWYITTPTPWNCQFISLTVEILILNHLWF